MSANRELSVTLQDVASPGMKPKDLVAAVRKKHPHASKKEIVRAAFYALTLGSTISDDKSQHLHDFAISQRGGSDDETPPLKRLKKKHQS